MRIAMIGTRGVPARYGGFETAVEEIGSRLAAQGHDVTVYGRGSRVPDNLYRGMRVRTLPAWRHPATETLSNAFLAALDAAALHRPDVVLLFNAANAPLVPLLRFAGLPVAVHIDGLEWKRAKWAGAGARYYRWAEGASVAWADEIVSDAAGIATHVLRTYGKESWFIPYGAPAVDRDDRASPGFGLASGQYHLVVARFEPENHVLDIVRGYAMSKSAWPLVVVGSSAYESTHSRKLDEALGSDPRLQRLGPLWDQSALDQLYAHAGSYLHGHSVGGTNPSLLRAMGAGAPVIAFDVSFNREVAGTSARYFSEAPELPWLLEDMEANPAESRRRGSEGRCDVIRRYQWRNVADDYLRLCQNLTERSRRTRGKQ
jgi:glycosyltransferase involved in cell wall biosynthesis